MGDVFGHTKVAYQQKNSKDWSGHKVVWAKIFFYFYKLFPFRGVYATRKHCHGPFDKHGHYICYTKDNFPCRTPISPS